MSDWHKYPRPLVNGKFHEDLDLIIEILGFHLYEWKEHDHQVWIRRKS